MSRKHFILLAAALRLHRATCNNQTDCDDLIRTVAMVCAKCNKLFSTDRFYAASNFKGLNDG